MKTKIEKTIEGYENDEVWYHGTDKKFNEFNLSNFGKTDDGWWGVGTYFHSDIETAKVYGNNIIKVLFNTNKILNLPVDYSGRFLFDKLNEIGFELPLECKNYSAMKIIKNIGKQDFTDVMKKNYDVIVINYAEGTKEAIVFNLNVINLRAANLSKYTNLQAGGNA